MKKRLLNEYFSKKTSREENEEIVKWFEKSAKNRSEFFSERNTWNAALLSKSDKQTDVLFSEKKKSFRFGRVMWYAASVAALLILSIGMLRYTENTPEGMQTVIVPAGQRVNLILADGTSVWLNSNTTFQYPASFSKKKREVSVIGEAYFDVAKNEENSFVVSTEKYQIEALGTSFNVYAYGNNFFETALFNGSVKVYDKEHKTDFLLQPNEKAFEKNKQLCKAPIEATKDYKWQNGILSFYDEPIQDVMDMLSAYYGKEICLKKNMKQEYHVTTKFLYNDGLDYILKIIQKDLHYKIEKDSINNIIYLR